jgi:hypothetical protein
VTVVNGIARARTLAVCLAGCLALTPAAAGAASRTALALGDPAAGRTALALGDPATRITVDGTLALVQSSNSQLLALVRGRRVAISCYSGLAALISQTPPPMGPFDSSTLGNSAVWPARASSVNIALPRDVSDTVDACILIGPNKLAIAIAAFTPAGKKTFEPSGRRPRGPASRGAEPAGLQAALETAMSTRTFDPHALFAPAHRLLATVRKDNPKFKFALAKTVKDVTRGSVIYLVLARTTRKHVTFAEVRGRTLTVSSESANSATTSVGPVQSKPRRPARG